MVVGSTCLATKLGVTGTAYIAPKTLGGTTWFTHTALQELLHQEGTLIWDYLLLCAWAFVYHLAIMVHNLGYQNWVVVLTIVSDGAVGASHL